MRRSPAGGGDEGTLAPARMRKMAALCKRVIAASTRQEALREIVEGLVDDLGFEAATLGLQEGAAGPLLEEVWHFRGEPIPAPRRERGFTALRERALRERQPVQEADDGPAGAGFRLCLPLIAGEDVIGAIALGASGGPAGPEEISLLECLGGQVAQILAKHRLLQELLETRDYLEGLVQATGDAILTVDRSGAIRRWNPAAERMFGYSADEVQGRPVSDLWPAGEAEEARRLHERAIAGDGVRMMRTRRLHRDGHLLDVLLTLSPIRDAAGRVVEVSSMVRDVSDRVRMESRFDDVARQVTASEERYRTLVEHAQEAIFLIDSEGLVIRDANPCAARLTGASADDLVGRSWLHLIAPAEREAVRLHLQLARERGGAPACEVPLDVAGALTILEITVSRVDASGERYLQIIGRDVTQRRQAEGEREALQHQLMQSEKLSVMGELLSGVAHELNNPLTAVIGYSQLLRDGTNPEGLKRNLDRIQEEAERCHRIVQNLLSFSRGRQAERVPLDLNRVVEETLELRAYQMRVDNIWVVKDLDPEAPAIVGDPHQLQQVLLNLITNAHHSLLSRAGGAVLTVSTQRRDDRVEVRIADNGPGIPEGIRERIFEPFFTTKGAGEGTGLGLSICQGILEEHGGRLSVHSDPDVETTFVLEIPTGAAVSRPDPATGRAPTTTAATEEIQERPRRVLVVDDEDSIREFLSEALRARGHEVDTAANGLIAFDRLRQSAYDAVITDLKMPGMNGRQLYERLRASDPQAAERVIFATGDLVARETMEFLQSTGNTYLEKPFSLRSIADALQKLDDQKIESSPGR